MDFAEVLRDFFHRHMPAAIAAGRHIRIAFRAVQRPAVEELLHAGFFILRNAVARKRYLDLGFALFARSRVVFTENRLIMLMHAAWHHTGADAERARHAELRKDRFADEVAFVGQVVQEFREFIFYLERDNLRLRFRFDRFTGHGGFHLGFA